MRFWSLITQHKLSFLMFVLVVAVGLRSFRIGNPPADWHAFRQADTASVTREYVKRAQVGEGIDLLRPQYHDLSNIQSGLDNLEGWRMVEFPIVNGAIAWLILALPGLGLAQLDLISRLMSIGFSLISIVSIYWLVRSISDRRTANLSALVMALLPYSIYYSRVIMPEPAMLAAASLALASFNSWLKTGRWPLYLLSALSLTLALLLKPFVAFMAPVFGALIILNQGWKHPKVWWLLPYGLAALPMLAWRDWITQFPSGIPASDWLYNKNGIRLRPAWFRWLFWERLTKLILGWTGAIFLLPNIFKLNKEFWIYGSWWAGMISYLIVFAGGNVQHDYYQVLLTPIIAISVARGFWLLQDFLTGTASWAPTTFQLKLQPRLALWLLTLLLGSSLLGSWYYVRGYFNVNHWEYVRAGAVVDTLTPPEAKIIAPAMGDTHFLYQTNRRGWPLGFHIQEKIDQGATHYVTTAMDDEANQLKANYQTIYHTDEFLLLDLTKPTNSTNSAQPN